MRRPLGVLAGLASMAVLCTPLTAAEAATASEAARCRVSVAKPRLNTALKIESFAARRGCFSSALLRIRIKRAVPGRDPVVKSGATRNGRVKVAVACAPGVYYATATDLRGRTIAKSKAARLSCAPGSGTPTPTPSGSPAPSPSTGTVGTAEENEVVRLTNAERAKGGCGPLKHDPQLRAASFGHSQEMAKRNRMDHTSQDGRSFTDRIKAAGFTGGSAWAENITFGQPSPAAVVQTWMNSSGHRANIMNCRFNLIGVGAAKSSRGLIYWTQVFVAR
ncbi:CAP domain-containing protein [Nonomuraea polychroma]|uniref:CAP domain-containing protein n=1 Tax=Nonomuraea polychroma TaxID=46176 RepID=UPI003D90A781